MQRWYAFQVTLDGHICIGEVMAEDASSAYAYALPELRIRVEYVLRTPPEGYAQAPIVAHALTYSLPRTRTWQGIF